MSAVAIDDDSVVADTNVLFSATNVASDDVECNDNESTDVSTSTATEDVSPPAARDENDVVSGPSIAVGKNAVGVVGEGNCVGAGVGDRVVGAVDKAVIDVDGVGIIVVEDVDGGVDKGIGLGVGKSVGIGVGLGVGKGVGAGVGRGVGAGVGAGVGTGVGGGVGGGVGDGVGDGVGAGVGAGVGKGVGDGVGAIVMGQRRVLHWH